MRRALHLIQALALVAVLVLGPLSVVAYACGGKLKSTYTGSHGTWHDTSHTGWDGHGTSGSSGTPTPTPPSSPKPGGTGTGSSGSDSSGSGTPPSSDGAGGGGGTGTGSGSEPPAGPKADGGSSGGETPGVPGSGGGDGSEDSNAPVNTAPAATGNSNSPAGGVVTEQGSDGKDRSSHGSLKSPSSSGKHASGASNGSDGVGGITASARATGAPAKPVAAAAVTTAAATKKTEDKREAAETKRVEKQRKLTTVARAVDGIPLAFRAALLLLIFATSILAVVSFRERRRATSVARIALLDHLTGLSNREGFDRQMATEWERAQRHGRPLGMIFVDLDHFKGFNDTHGHVAGDRLLREVAAAITATARGADFTARLGGDEFVVVCPDTDADGLDRLTERLRVAAAGMAVSLSIGAASKRDSDNSPDELVHRADLAMYESKGGRRRGASSANPMLGSLRRG